MLYKKSFTETENDCKPVRPAPATPNTDPIMATPAVDASAVAPAVPMTTPAPAAINGAARPPVSPVQQDQLTHQPESNITGKHLLQVTPASSAQTTKQTYKQTTS